MTDETPRRRGSDREISAIRSDMDAMRRDLSTIRDMLISEPEASPLGRALQARANRNEKRIDQLEVRTNRIEGWVGIEDPPVTGRKPLIVEAEHQKGVLTAVRWQITLLGAAVAIITIWRFVSGGG